MASRVLCVRRDRDDHLRSDVPLANGGSEGSSNGANKEAGALDIGKGKAFRLDKEFR